MLEFLGQMKMDIPVILLVNGLKRETAAEFILKGPPIVLKWIALAICL